MADFFPALLAELGARRRRLRAALGDRGQSLFELAFVGALSAGSLGLLLAPWMGKAAPWGFALPFVFAAGYLYLDIRRQRAAAAAADDEGRAAVRKGSDRLALIWTVLLILAGAATFIYAFNAQPPPPPPPPSEAEGWSPPENAVSVDLQAP